MRDFLDSILEFIGATALTDQEYAETQPMESNEGEYTVEVYNALKDVLTERETITTMAAKLKSYFAAAGTVIDAPSYVPASQILIGVALD